MKHFISLFAFALLLPCTAVNAQSTSQYIAGPITADVIEVIDGDTIKVRIRPWLFTEITTSIRLRGVDAPEVNRANCAQESALGAKATDHIVQMLLSEGPGAQILVSNIEPDKYSGRVVATASTLDGNDLATSLLAVELAQPYSGGSRPDWCA